jgi:hypothetical protein
VSAERTPAEECHLAAVATPVEAHLLELLPVRLAAAALRPAAVKALVDVAAPAAAAASNALALAA